MLLIDLIDHYARFLQDAAPAVQDGHDTLSPEASSTLPCILLTGLASSCIVAAINFVVCIFNCCLRCSSCKSLWTISYWSPSTADLASISSTSLAWHANSRALAFWWACCISCVMPSNCEFKLLLTETQCSSSFSRIATFLLHSSISDLWYSMIVCGSCGSVCDSWILQFFVYVWDSLSLIFGPSLLGSQYTFLLKQRVHLFVSVVNSVRHSAHLLSSLALAMKTTNLLL